MSPLDSLGPVVWWTLSSSSGQTVLLAIITGQKKEGYPSITIKCITDYNRHIFVVYGPQFGTRKDKEIVKLDPNVKKIHVGWFSKIWWHYYTEAGQVSREKGVYLICDNGYYLQWPQLICPYTVDEPCHTEAGFFSSNIESVRKHIGCTFGILKKGWQILNNGLQFCDIGDCNKIFIMCCYPQNYLLDVMEWNDVCVGWGRPFDGDGIWLDGHTNQPS